MNGKKFDGMTGEISAFISLWVYPQGKIGICQDLDSQPWQSKSQIFDVLPRDRLEEVSLCFSNPQRDHRITIFHLSQLNSEVEGWCVSAPRRRSCSYALKCLAFVVSLHLYEHTKYKKKKRWKVKFLKVRELSASSVSNDRQVIKKQLYLCRFPSGMLPRS